MSENERQDEMSDPTAPGSTGQAPVGSGGTKQGMSTGAKVLLGCGALLLLGAVAMSVALFLGGRAAMRMVESTVGAGEDQARASELLEALETEHAFTIPEGGALTPDGVRRFLAVSDDAWQAMEGWATDLGDLNRRMEDGADLGAMLDAARGVGGMVRSRAALAEALDAHDMPLSEFIWTGVTLSGALDDGNEGAPAANRTLARDAAQSAPWLENGGSDAADPSMVLGVAVLWGMSDLSTWRALGLDTLSIR